MGQNMRNQGNKQCQIPKHSELYFQNKKDKG
jgi:hypothetical protein